VTPSESRYSGIIAAIFKRHYKKGATSFEFERAEMETIAKKLKIKLPKNLGDLIYSFRFRQPLPESITSTAPEGRHWIIEGAGKGKYRFRLATATRIEPNAALVAVKIPDATPEIITKYAQSDEQALLAKVRYNRLIDIFLSVTANSLQSHLRTSVAGVGQIEIDELYVAVDAKGAHFVVPVQAKGGNDQIGVVQTSQDLAFCDQRYPALVARAVAAQFMTDDVIAMFELVIEDGDVRIRQERHYRLVPGGEISDEDLASYRI
jgi:hypothetical protein